MSTYINKKAPFIVKQKKFTCKNCKEINLPIKGTCRNHCRKCLYSMHLDEIGPGDRQSSCKGLMGPLQCENTGNKGYILYHQCLKCGIIKKNKIAKDDDWDIIIQKSNIKYQK